MTVNIDRLFAEIGEKRLFTRELLENVRSQLSFESTEPFTLPDIYGNRRNFEVKLHGDDSNTIPIIKYHSYHQMADEDPYAEFNMIRRFNGEEGLQRWLKSPEYQERLTENKFPISISFVSGPLEDDQLDERRKQFQAQKEAWEGSKEHHHLVEQLQKHAKDSIQITKIVCFGLGALRRSERSMKQHHAAVTIAQTLSKLYSPESPQAIPIFTQEPEYNTTDRTILGSFQPRFNILTDPNALLSIDSTTLVMTIGADTPVRQVVADLTHPFGGPAGILCDTIEEDDCRSEHTEREIHGQIFQLKAYTTDPSSKRVVEMVDPVRFISAEVDIRGKEFGALGGCTLYLKKRETGVLN